LSFSKNFTPALRKAPASLHDSSPELLNLQKRPNRRIRLLPRLFPDQGLSASENVEKLYNENPAAIKSKYFRNICSAFLLLNMSDLIFSIHIQSHCWTAFDPKSPFIIHHDKG
jgi:hypothetical protein